MTDKTCGECEWMELDIEVCWDFFCENPDSEEHLQVLRTHDPACDHFKPKGDE